MTTLSIILPDPLAKASQDAAVKLGISRTQFIRQAIAHELDNFQAQLEQEAIVKSISAMKNDKKYLKEVENIEDGLNADLPNDGEEWWKEEILTQGGIYLAKLNPAKAAEVGKIRPVVILNAQAILDIIPPTIFICPLSSQSQPEFSSLHVKLSPRDNLKVTSYALVEHCRAITIRRIVHPRLGQLTSSELSVILHRLQRLVGL